MKRSAPKDGYNAGFKPTQRRQVWKTLSAGLQGKPSLQVLMLPSAEGDEIAWCEGKGFRRQNIHCVDRNPAIVANLQRKYPGIQTYGVPLDQASERIHRSGTTIDVANLDLCGPVGNGLCHLLDHMSNIGLWSEYARVAVTALRGREQRDAMGEVMRRCVAHISFDGARREVVKAALGGNMAAVFLGALRRKYAVTCVREETYRSAAGTQTMAWWVFKLTSWECAKGAIERAREQGNRMSRLARIVHEESALMRCNALAQKAFRLADECERGFLSYTHAQPVDDTRESREAATVRALSLVLPRWQSSDERSRENIRLEIGRVLGCSLGVDECHHLLLLAAEAVSAADAEDAGFPQSWRERHRDGKDGE